MEIHALSGKRGSGKTYLANQLYQLYKEDKSVVITSIADELKREFCKYSGVDFSRMLNDYEYKTRKRSQLLQYARYIKDKCGETYWIDCFLKTLEKRTEQIIIISDMRLDFELEKIQIYCLKHNIHLETHRLEPPEGVREKRGYVHDKDIDNNKFETGLDNIIDWNHIHRENEFGL